MIACHTALNTPSGSFPRRRLNRPESVTGQNPPLPNLGFTTELNGDPNV
jgi:hypothetical protein